MHSDNNSYCHIPKIELVCLPLQKVQIASVLVRSASAVATKIHILSNRMASPLPRITINKGHVCVHMDGYDPLDVRNDSMLYITYNGDYTTEEQCHRIVACSSMRYDDGRAFMWHTIQ